MNPDDYSTAQVYGAISAALQANDMPAVVDLLHLLAVKDPKGARAIVAMVEALSSGEAAS